MVRNITILILALNSLFLSAQVKFDASVSKTKLGLNERLRVDFVMNQNGDNFSPPDFENFQIIGGPNQSIKTSYVNGERSFSKTYSYFLQPLKKGSIRIKQASIEIDGDYDWYKYSLEKGKIYRFTINSISLVKPSIRLRSSSLICSCCSKSETV